MRCSCCRELRHFALHSLTSTRHGVTQSASGRRWRWGWHGSRRPLIQLTLKAALLSSLLAFTFTLLLFGAQTAEVRRWLLVGAEVGCGGVWTPTIFHSDIHRVRSLNRCFQSGRAESTSRRTQNRPKHRRARSNMRCCHIHRTQLRPRCFCNRSSSCRTTGGGQLRRRVFRFIRVEFRRK